MAIAISFTYLLPTTATAGEYRLVFASRNEIVLIDSSRVKSLDAKMKTAWSVSLRPIGKELVGASYIQMLSQYDCGTRTNRVMSLAVYKRDGSFISSSDRRDKQWRPSIPESAGEAVLTFVCEGTTAEGRRAEGFGQMSLAEIVRSVYDGPWPVN
jgi:hypothetical protein